MSIENIRAALETALAGVTPAIDTAWENYPYTPVPNVPYQRVHIVFAQPNNEEYGSNWQEIGTMFVNLYYPQQTGPSVTDARITALRNTFARGTTLTSGGVAVTINATPEAGPSFNDGEYYVRPVRIRFYSNLY